MAVVEVAKLDRVQEHGGEGNRQHARRKAAVTGLRAVGWLPARAALGRDDDRVGEALDLCILLPVVVIPDRTASGGTDPGPTERRASVRTAFSRLYPTRYSLITSGSGSRPRPGPSGTRKAPPTGLIQSPYRLASGVM